MSSTFGTPTYTEPTAADAAAPSDAPQDVAEQLDPNDPRLTSEALDVNVDADAYALPAPPPDAKYRAKLTLEQVEYNGAKVDYKPALWGSAPPQAVFVAAVKATLIDPSGKLDGVPVYERNVATFMSKDGSTKVSTIIARLKKPDGTAWIEKGRKYSPKEWIELLVKALAGEPEIGIETIWEWSCQGCGEEAKKAGHKYPKSIKGMNKFPFDAAAKKYTPELKCMVNVAHGYSRARATIARFLSLGELK